MTTAYRRISRLRASAALAVAMALTTSATEAFAQSAPAAPSAKVAAGNADDLFERGYNAYTAGRNEEAHQLFTQAFALKPTHDIAANLGYVELKLGKKRDAAEHFAFSLSVFPANGDAKQRADLEAKLAEAKATVATLKVQASVGGAKILIDSIEVGKEPLGREIYLEPGGHIVRAETDDMEAEHIASFPAGSSTDVALPMKVRVGGKPKGGGGAPMWPVGLLSGVAAAGLGVGIAGFVLRGQRQSDADAALAALEDGSCGPSGEACSEVNDLLSEGDGFLAMGITGMVVAGAAGVGALIYGLGAPSAGPPAKQAIKVLPLVGTTNGFILEGRF